MHRFFVDASQVLEKVILIEGDDVKHIRKVLRLRIGDEIEVSDSTAWEYRCRILSMDEHLVEATIIDKQRFARESCFVTFTGKFSKCCPFLNTGSSFSS